MKVLQVVTDDDRRARRSSPRSSANAYLTPTTRRPWRWPPAPTVASTWRFSGLHAGPAVQLVIQAGAIGSHGDALVLDMGEPVRVADVARHRTPA